MALRAARASRKNECMKTILHSVSYAGLWGQAFLSLDDFVDRAKKLGYDGVMLMAKRPHLSVLEYDAARLAALRERVESRGLTVACLAGYNDFGLGYDRADIPVTEMQKLYIRELSRVAQGIGCKLIRVFTAYSSKLASETQLWNACVSNLRECASMAADFGVTLGVQNHHDSGVHFESFADMLEEIDHPNCKALFDAWAPALQGDDLVAAAKRLAPHMVHTTVADYVKRPRFRYEPALVNYVRETDVVRAVPMGEGFIDYRSFFSALLSAGYKGGVAYEMCSPLRGGGSEENLDRCARQFREYIAALRASS
jgi:sugar phosphate isomerase/epimerase